MKNFLFFIILFSALHVDASIDSLRYRVVFNDKGFMFSQMDSPPSLSARALARRATFGIGIDSTDYPVCPGYLKSLRDSGFVIVATSRWMNSAVVSVPDKDRISYLLSLPFVNTVELVWVNPYKSTVKPLKNSKKLRKLQVDSASYYGKAEAQNNMIGLEPLHMAGFKGNGIRIAVVDAGFKNVDSLTWFRDLKLVAAKDFIYPPTSIYDGHYHGTAVLSIMSSNANYSFTGSAPEAEYCLLRSEDIDSEFPIEEDYWIAAVEYADSLGSDIISSSLGYTQFDSTFMSYNISQLDGKTAFISRAAGIAVKKGMLVVNSAGNDGQMPWKKISFPGDVEGVLSVGSVNSSQSKSSFSSFGPSSDGRIKPDVMAMGSGTTIISSSGGLSSGSGTSFASPLISGMAACLWQAFPTLSVTELVQQIRNSSDRSTKPDSLYGYGIPNAYKLWLSLQEYPIKKDIPDWYCFPNPADDKLYIANFTGSGSKIKCVVFDMTGKKVIVDSFNGQYHTLDVSRLEPSVYLVNLYRLGKLMSGSKIIIQR